MMEAAEAAFARLGRNGEGPHSEEPTPYSDIPSEFDDRKKVSDIESAGSTNTSTDSKKVEQPPPVIFNPITTLAWQGTEPVKRRMLAQGRIPLGDLTILTGNGGSGKTEIATALLIAVPAGLGDWLGCVVDETGPALFISCEEPEEDIRDRIERISKHRGIDPHAIGDLHLFFPELDATWLGTADRLGRITKTPLLEQIETWIRQHRPRLVVIDSVAAVFDGEAIARRQVRAFLAMLRKIDRNGSAVRFGQLIRDVTLRIRCFSARE